MNPSWQKAKIVKSAPASFDIRSLVLKPESYIPYRAGQHYELRMPGSDISRKYSIASSPYEPGDSLEFGVQLIRNGVLSPQLWGLAEGSEIEIRGPLGESFVWDADASGPLVLLGAGSGITPLLSIYRAYRFKYPHGTCAFVMSAKDASRIMHYDALKDILITRFTATEERIDLGFLKDPVGALAKNPQALFYICGPDGFIDEMVDNVLELGALEANVKSEKFT